jgi:hemoglobin/transferrin/lactoferrin receptor protein
METPLPRPDLQFVKRKTCLASLSRSTMRTAKPSCAMLALALTLAASPSKGQVADEDASNAGETITVTATRVPQAIKDVPAIVTVKNDEQIADELASDIRDLVRFEPGVSVRRAPSRFTAALGSTGQHSRD